MVEFNDRRTPSYRAERRQVGKKSEVHLFDEEGNFVSKHGGARAERAQAVIVTQWDEKETPGVWGLRGDIAKAQSEATKLVTQKESKTRYGVVPVRNPRWAKVVPVVDRP